jgi:hypothetical protein
MVLTPEGDASAHAGSMQMYKQSPTRRRVRCGAAARTNKKAHLV